MEWKWKKILIGALFIITCLSPALPVPPPNTCPSLAVFSWVLHADSKWFVGWGHATNDKYLLSDHCVQGDRIPKHCVGFLFAHKCLGSMEKILKVHTDLYDDLFPNNESVEPPVILKSSERFSGFLPYLICRFIWPWGCKELLFSPFGWGENEAQESVGLVRFT